MGGAFTAPLDPKNEVTLTHPYAFGMKKGKHSKEDMQ